MNKTNKPLFSQNFLSHLLIDFRLSNVPKIKLTRDIIKNLISELNSGKIENLKEEALASRFINQFFGDILGFNYGNSNFWTLSEEVKTKVDGTKVDGALGYFNKNKDNNDVRAVIEIKNAKTSLDEKQKRKDSKSPVSQAFEYASKMGDKCDWIIVSNFKEIRFYYKSQDKFQVFFLKDLSNEEKLKELLFLFHIDRFIKKEKKSNTENLYKTNSFLTKVNDIPRHIVDEIYSSLKRFKGLQYIDPNYLASLKPFNILNEYVWHYDNGILFTINPKIHNLFLNLDFDNGDVKISPELKKELEDNNVIEYEYKINSFIKSLNHSKIHTIRCIEDYSKILLQRKKVIGFTHKHMFHFTDKEGYSKSINILKYKSCDCIVCNFKSFDFKHLLSKLKIAKNKNEPINLEYAYGNYLVSSNNYKDAYSIYKSLSDKTKGIEGLEVEYFLSKLNMKYLYSLIQENKQMKDSIEIKEEARNIDLNKVLYEEIEYSISDDVRNYLLKIKEETLLIKTQDKVEDLHKRILNLKKHSDNGYDELITSNDINMLSENHLNLEAHLNKNNIIYNVFHKYKLLSAKIFDGFLNSLITKNYGLKTLNSSYLLEFIMNVNPSEFQKSLKQVKALNLNSDCNEEIIQNITNLFSSYYDDSSFSDSVFKNRLLEEYLIDYGFNSRFRGLITNSFTILSKIETPHDLITPLTKVIIKFLTVEDELGWNELKEFENFLIEKGDTFTPQQLINIIKISIERGKPSNNKYDGLVEKTSISLNNFYPNIKIENKQLIKRAVANISIPYEWKIVSYLLLISNEECIALLNKEIEEFLDTKFYTDIYEHLIGEKLYNYKKKEYFKKLILDINDSKKVVFKNEFKDNNPIYRDNRFYRLILLSNILEIDKKSKVFNLITNTSEYEKWLLNPKDFDYSKFDMKWLLFSKNIHIVKGLRGIRDLNILVDSELKKEFNSELSKIYYQYLLQN